MFFFRVQQFLNRFCRSSAVASAGQDCQQILKLEARIARQTTQLEAINRELDILFYSVSHDLRAPLRRITSWAELLKFESENQLSPRARDHLGRLSVEAERMEALMDYLVEISRVTSTSVALPANLSIMAQTLATHFQEMHPDRQMEFVIQPGVQVLGDPALLRIVLITLLENACKFSATRPLARIEFGEEERAGERVFFVRDNGVGFDMNRAQKLFGPFQRMHGKAEFPGAGVGLAMVQRIIHQSGGRVWAEARENEGAAFYFTLKEVA